MTIHVCCMDKIYIRVFILDFVGMYEARDWYWLCWLLIFFFFSISYHQSIFLFVCVIIQELLLEAYTSSCEIQFPSPNAKFWDEK